MSSFLLSPYWHRQLVKFSQETSIIKGVEKDQELSKIDASYCGRTYRKLKALFKELCQGEGEVPLLTESVSTLIDTMVKVGLFKPENGYFFMDLVHDAAHFQGARSIFFGNVFGSSSEVVIPSPEKLPLKLRDGLIARLINKGAFFYIDDIQKLADHKLLGALSSVCEIAKTFEIVKATFIAACYVKDAALIKQAFNKLSPQWILDKEIVHAIFRACNTNAETIFQMIQEGLPLEIEFKNRSLLRAILGEGNPLLIRAVFSKVQPSPLLFSYFAEDELPNDKACSAFKIWRDLNFTTSQFQKETFIIAIRNLAKIGCAEGLKWILENIPKELQNEKNTFLNQGDEEEKTPFFIACESDFGGEAALFLLDQGIDCKKKNDEDDLPLRFTVMNGYHKVVKEIFSQMSEVEKKDFLNTKDSFGKSPLSLAIQGGHLEVVELLLEENADLSDWMGRNNSHLSESIINNDKRDRSLAIIDLLFKKGGEEILLPLLSDAVKFSIQLEGSSKKQQRKDLEHFVQAWVNRYPEKKKDLLNQIQRDWTLLEMAIIERSFLTKVLLENGARIRTIDLTKEKAIAFQNLFKQKLTFLKRLIAEAPKEEQNKCLDLSRWKEVSPDEEFDALCQWMRLIVEWKGKEKIVADELISLLEKNGVGDKLFPLFIRVVDEALPSEKKRIFEHILATQKAWFKEGVDLSFLILNQIEDYTLVLKFPGGIRKIGVYKEVMAMRSPYFKGLFSDKFPDVSQGEKIYHFLSKVEADYFEAFVMFLFSEKIEVTHENFKALASLANAYDSPSLRKVLDRWIQNNPECNHWKNNHLDLHLKAARKDQRKDQGENFSKKIKTEEK